MEQTAHSETPALSKGAALALKVLAVVAVLYTLYLAKTLFIPIVVAAFIALFSSRLVCWLTRVAVPKMLGAALVILLLIAGTGYTVGFLVEPAGRWLNDLPNISENLSERLEGMSEPVKAIKQTVLSGNGDNNGNSSAPETLAETMDTAIASLVALLAQSTAMFAAQLLAVIVITYFFLVFGHDLMLGLVRAQKHFSEKRLAVTIFDAIRDDISRYFLTIAMINTGLGLATAGAMYLLGVEDPLLWGAMAGILNFAPYVGPLIMIIVLTLVGLSEFSTPLATVAVPLAFMALNFIECQLVTPTVLGKRFNMNPLVVVVWLFLWGWLWGAVGMLIAIPLLVCFKIVATNMDLVGDWVKVLDGPRAAEVKRRD